MKSIIPKILLVFLALLMPATMSAYDFEVDGIYYSLYGPHHVSVTFKDANYNSYSGDVVIPSQIEVGEESYTVYNVGANAFKGSTGLTSVVLPSTVQSIREGAFRDCENLTNIEIVNRLTTFGRSAFKGCKSLESIYLPIFLTELPDSLLYGCESLTTINIPNHSDLKTIGNDVFNGCTGLTSVRLPGAVETYGDGVFRNCTSLTQVTLRGNVQSIGAAMFYGCTNLTDVVIPNTVKNIKSHTFYRCENLANITLSDSLESIGEDAFYHCKALTQLSLPNTVKTIGREAFGESGLTSFVVPDLVTVIENNTFIDCYSLRDIVFHNNLKTIGSQSFLSTRLQSVVIPNSVTRLEGAAFAYCQSLEHVQLSDSLTMIYERVFSNTNLTEITIPPLVTKIFYSAFSRCMKLENVFIPKSVIQIAGDAFGECNRLSTIVVEDGNPVYDSRENCNAIIETATNTLLKGGNRTVIPNTVTSIAGNAFKRSNLTQITIPEPVSSIGGSAFEGCGSLQEVNIAKSVTSIGTHAFLSCSGMQRVNIDSQNPVYDSRENCNAIIETASNTLLFGFPVTVIPEGITTIAQDAFYYTSNWPENNGVRRLNIPSTVTYIGQGAFGSCTNPFIVVCRAAVPPTLESENSFYTNNYTNATLHVPEASLDAYKTAMGWKNFSVITPLGDDGEPMSETARPYVTWTYSPNFDYIKIGLHNNSSDPDATIYYHVAKKPYTIQPYESTEWTEYTEPILFDELGNYMLEYYAIAPGKIMSHIVHYNLDIESFDPLDWAADFSFRVDGIHYRILSESTVGVCARYRESHENGHWQQDYPSVYSGDIVIPETVTFEDVTYTVTTILEDAFWSSELTSISLPNTLTCIDQYAFYNCKLPEINIPTSVTTIGREAFMYSSLPAVTIPASVEHLGQAAFCSVETLKVDSDNPVYDSRNNCNAVIETVTNTLVMGCRYGKIPVGVEAIGDSAYVDIEYYNANNYMAIPNTVHSIGKEAVNSFNLEIVRFGESVEFIDTRAFYNCFGIYTIVCHSMTPPNAYDAFLCENYEGDLRSPYDQATLYVPEGSIEAYRNHEEWGRFMEIKEFNDQSRYDTNGDGQVNISDVTYLINLLMDSQYNWLPYDADVNRDGDINITDITIVINYMMNN